MAFVFYELKVLLLLHFDENWNCLFFFAKRLCVCIDVCCGYVSAGERYSHDGHKCHESHDSVRITSTKQIGGKNLISTWKSFGTPWWRKNASDRTGRSAALALTPHALTHCRCSLRVPHENFNCHSSGSESVEREKKGILWFLPAFWSNFFPCLWRDETCFCLKRHANHRKMQCECFEWGNTEKKTKWMAQSVRWRLKRGREREWKWKITYSFVLA